MRPALIKRLLLTLAAATLAGFSPVPDSSSLQDCANGVCTLRMTAPQLLAAAEKAVIAQRYDQARPMLAALSNAPELTMERHFLLGYIAAQTNELKRAESEFRSVLRERPDMTRARLELAQVLLRQGKEAAADHHYRLAEEDAGLPPEVEQTIRQVRGYIRSNRNWTFNVTVGLSPDSNINSATDAQTVTFLGWQFPLDPSARRKSGVGQTVGANGSVRLRLKDGLAMVVDANGQFTNHRGSDADDLSALIAAGPELTMKNGARIAIQAVGHTRVYGGKVAQQGPGVRVSYQQNLDKGQRVSALVDVRKVNSHFSPAYDGTSYGAYLTYERVIRRSMVASATLYGRRDDLRSGDYSSRELGFNLGIGGELPKGINAGLSAGISRALFDDPIVAFDPDPRKDWRFNGRANVGLRSVRVLGFSPSMTYTFTKTSTKLPLYRNERHRLEFSLARYF
ncbi:MAG: surface lipoprotein assembly modifier [Sphingomonadaceae bacterium]